MTGVKYPALLIGAGVIVVGALLLHRAPATPGLSTGSSPAPFPPHHRSRRVRASSTPAGDAVVYVVGAVRRPGLYRLGDRARNDDAVRAAGGFLAEADVTAVDLAAYARDGDEVFVPLLGQSIPRVAQHRVRSARRSKTSAIIAAVDVNTASAAELARVPGIGPAIAERIVAIRASDGNYTSLDQLLDVAAMTQSRLDRAAPYLRI